MPDLTPVNLAWSPPGTADNPIIGTATMQFAFSIKNIGGAPTDPAVPIVFTFYRPNGLTIDWAHATLPAGVMYTQASPTMSPIFTYSGVIPAGGSISLSLPGAWVPPGVMGSVVGTVRINNGSGGESNTANNAASSTPFFWQSS